jgi:trehalose synthase-like protein
MQEKNPGKTVVADESGKRSEPTHQGDSPIEVAQNPVKEPALAAPLSPPLVERRFRQTDLPARFIERRKNPRISTEQPPLPAPPRFDDYAPIIGKPELDEIRFLARHLRGKSVKMVNSTALGGGVAEILNRLIPLMNELEVLTRWDVITGGNDFFEVTKGFHNAL